MAIAAGAPGKLVLLGEYAVLDGAEALVMAVGRRARAMLEPASGRESALTVDAGAERAVRFDTGGPSGEALVDAVTAAAPALTWSAWRGRLDSSAFYLGEDKLGLGSSAAALTAWAGAWWRAAAPDAPPPSAETLISVHRAFQGGTGSGLDVAAARLGGALIYRLEADFVPHIGSVRLPNSVGFAGIFAGSSASTVDFVAGFRAWQRTQPAGARAMHAAMRDIAAMGCAATRAGNGVDLVAAMAAYGDSLDRLGEAMSMDLVTREHREIGRLARRFDVVYKVSGAGGGDLGIAASVDRTALEAFTAAVGRLGYHVVDIPLDERGLVVEELG